MYKKILCFSTEENHCSDIECAITLGPNYGNNTETIIHLTGINAFQNDFSTSIHVIGINERYGLYKALKKIVKILGKEMEE